MRNDTQHIIDKLSERMDTLSLEFKAHSREEMDRWDTLTKFAESTEKNSLLLEEHLDGLRGITNLINSSKMIKAFVTYVVFPVGAIIGSIIALKEWIIK